MKHATDIYLNGSEPHIGAGNSLLLRINCSALAPL
jgi:hypothetical protein